MTAYPYHDSREIAFQLVVAVELSPKLSTLVMIILGGACCVLNEDVFTHLNTGLV